MNERQRFFLSFVGTRKSCSACVSYPFVYREKEKGCMFVGEGGDIIANLFPIDRTVKLSKEKLFKLIFYILTFFHFLLGSTRRVRPPTN